MVQHVCILYKQGHERELQDGTLAKAQGDGISANELLAKTEKLYIKLVPIYDKKKWLSDIDIDGLVVLISR